MAVELRLFGYPQVSRNGQHIQIELRKALALLAHLSVTGRAQSRDALAELLWPDAPPGGGRARLRRTLYRLQQLLGDDVLDPSVSAVALNPETLTESDVARFRRLEARCRQPDISEAEERDCLTRAIALYTEEFLAGFNMPDCQRFDDWQLLVAEDLPAPWVGCWVVDRR